MRRKYLKRGRSDPTIGRPAVTFKFGDECSLSKRDISNDTPVSRSHWNDEKTNKHVFSSDFKNQINLLQWK